MSDKILHTIPGYGNEDTTWLQRQNPFERQEIIRQIEFKKKYLKNLLMTFGEFPKRPEHCYIHILPKGTSQESVYEPSIAADIADYIRVSKIASHSETLNLKSSQVCCLNIMFFLRKNIRLAAEVFRSFFPDLKSVNWIEFEYTGLKGTTEFLGEPQSGKRGQHRTSIDCALEWTDQQNRNNILLIEWKYTEKDFGSCSYFADKKKPLRSNCKSISERALQDLTTKCPLAMPGRNLNRKYWNILSSLVDDKVLRDRPGCLFQGPMYQLLRQCLVANFIRQSAQYNNVQLAVVFFEGNNSLRSMPKTLEGLVRQDDFGTLALIETLLGSTYKYLKIPIKTLMKAVDSQNPLEKSWRTYINDRYGV